VPAGERVAEHVLQSLTDVYHGALHHVELRTSDLAKAETSWRWLLTELGYTPFQRWEAGRSLKFKDT
jgi:hypothetical protein